MVRLAENLPIGGTAVGTGINTHPRFGKLVAGRLSKATGVKFSEAANHFEAQATRDCVVEASGELKTIAVSLSRIANDMRWLGSGLRSWMYGLLLPPTPPPSAGRVCATPTLVSAGSHSPLDARHSTPADCVGCEQTPIWQVSSVQPRPSSVHAVPSAVSASPGQAVATPSHVSCGSHSSVDARQTTPAD